MNRKSKELLRLLMILIGNILDAAGFVLFVSGSGLITGGTSGIGLFLSRQTGIPTSVYVFIINAVMLVVGLIFLGKRFALSTILSTFCYPLAMAMIKELAGLFYESNRRTYLLGKETERLHGATQEQLARHDRLQSLI